MNGKTGPSRSEPVKPHPVLPDYYTDPAHRPAFVRQLFDHTARHYDLINRMLSLGSGNRYRRCALERAGLRPGMQVLDVATGTGLLARQAVQVTGSPDAVLGLDASFGMLTEARALNIGLIQGAVEQLPITDESRDFLSMGYALRHVADLDSTFREFYRVLRAPGTLLILEIGTPPDRLSRILFELYLGRLIPWLSRWTTGQPQAQTLMRYYRDTIVHCVPAETILEAMTRAGFTETACTVEWGLFRAYRGCKRSLRPNPGSA